jgi:hypothetical protein
MRSGGALAKVFGPLVGTGPGAGMALMLVFAGVFAMLAAFGAYAYRPLRTVEATLPDHDEAADVAEAGEAAQIA